MTGPSSKMSPSSFAAANLLLPARQAAGVDAAAFAHPFHVAKHYHVEDKDMLRQQSLDMQRDAATVMNLLKQYDGQPVEAQRIDQFIADFETIRSILIDRIAVEESIVYPATINVGAPRRAECGADRHDQGGQMAETDVACPQRAA